MPCLGRTGEFVKTSRSIGEFSFEWRFHFYRIALCGRGTSYKSPEFRFCNARWCFVIYQDPFGEDAFGPSDALKFNLRRKDAGPSKAVKITIGIKGGEYRGEAEKEFSIYESTHLVYTIHNVRQLAEKKYRLIEDNILTLSCSLKSDEHNAVRDEESLPKIEEDSEVPRKCQGLDELQSSLQNLLRSGDDSDVIIKVQGKEFPAHRAILRARSPVFQKMFAHDMVETQRGVVTMEDCDKETFPEFLEHVYTGSVQMISAVNVVSLYEVSDKYDLKTLRKECTQFMRRNLTAACFCDAMTVAVTHDEKELIEIATQFFCDNALEIVKTAEWQIFLKENTTVGNELLIKLLTK